MLQGLRRRQPLLRSILHQLRSQQRSQLVARSVTKCSSGATVSKEATLTPFGLSFWATEHARLVTCERLQAKRNICAWTCDSGAASVAKKKPSLPAWEEADPQVAASLRAQAMQEAVGHLAGEVPGGAAIQVHDGKALGPVLAALLLLGPPPGLQVVVCRRQPPVQIRQALSRLDM